MEALSISKNDSFLVYDREEKSFYKDGSKLDLEIYEEDLRKFNDTLAKTLESSRPVALFTDCRVRCVCGEFMRRRLTFVKTGEKDREIIITLSEDGLNDCNDQLTGLLTRNGFYAALEERVLDAVLPEDEEYILVYFDIHRFKTVNDMFGMADGDRLLRHIARVINDTVGADGAGCRIESDRFAFFAKCKKGGADALMDKLLDGVSGFDLPFEIICNAGIYVFTGERLTAEAAVDRAIIAMSVIKGSYTNRYNYYTESLRKNLLTEQEITGIMKTALKNEQFVIYYQPQYNHSTGMLVGAEALVRWKHPEKGLISPGVFIPVFEKNGFITKLDSYVFDRVCRFIRECLDKKLPVVPISANLTRYDIFSPDFIESLEKTRKKFDIPAKYIRVEITESAALGNSQFINEAVKKLHSYGFMVEMDDFGSGYSSLNILKDIDFDVIKLDMKFLQKTEEDHNRGGTILSSVVRMVNWLDLPIIAEGVETVRQADFLKSIGCYYIQGFLYSRPLPEEEYLKLISSSSVGAMIPQMKLIDTLNAGDFWSEDSLETLIFSNLVGGAAIFEFKDGRLEILRVNQKYLQELGMNLSERELVNKDFLNYFDDENKEIYLKTLEKAIQTGDEQECETWRDIKSPCCGEERICIRSSMRLIGNGGGDYLFYCMIRNITGERMQYGSILDSEHRFKMACEQVNIYYWEYTVATKEMRPCFRCMRDLGLPPLLTNYPDSAIEMGVFPPETADMYRDWHRQIAEGVPKLEAIIPLTMDRVPFHVRYTTEFDENGRAIKAYGSAALVVDNK